MSALPWPPDPRDILRWARPSDTGVASPTDGETIAEPAAADDDDGGLLDDVSAWWSGVAGNLWPAGSEETKADAVEGEAAAGEDPSVLDAVREQIAAAIIASIRAVSSERDREEIVRWFVNAERILERDGTTAEKAAALYATVSTRRLAGILANAARTSVLNYGGSGMPLALKVAMPVTLGGLALLGTQGAGIVAFGGGVGLPVALLLFLGTAGATTVVEAFAKDRGVRDPLTKLMMTLIAADSARRIDKELLRAMRADAMVPERAEVPSDHTAILDHLVTMDPFVFERHVMTFFEDMGYTVGVTPKANDGGFDGYVVHPDGLIVVQCKRNALDNPVGGPTIHQLMGVVTQQKAYRAYAVTTSQFTEAAVKAAATCDRMVLIDGTELVQWHVDQKRTR
jgi:restriction system protein